MQIHIVFSEWRQQATEPLTFQALLERPTEANIRTALFDDEEGALAFKRAVEAGELTPGVWERTGAQEI